MNRAPRRRPGLAQVWGHGRLGEAQVRAPPFPLSGGLLLPREQRCGPGSPRRGPPSAPAAAQTRGEGERAPAPMRLQWRGWSLAREPGAPDVVAAGGRALPAALPARARCGSSCPAVTRADAAQPPPDGAAAVLGGCLCAAGGGAGPRRARHPRKAEGEPRRPQPHAPPGAATGPRAPAGPAPAPQCVVEGLGAGRLAACYRPGEAVTWLGGRAGSGCCVGDQRYAGSSFYFSPGLNMEPWERTWHFNPFKETDLIQALQLLKVFERTVIVSTGKPDKDLCLLAFKETSVAV